MYERFLIIGIGHIFAFHVRAIRHVIPGAVISATDTDKSKAKEAQAMDVTFANDFDSALSASDIVVVCVPCVEHYAVTKKALLAGKTVLLEKPPTKTNAEFLDLVKIAKSVPGARLICAFHAAYGLDIAHFVQEMKDGIHSEYGKLVEFRSEFDDPYKKNGKIISNLGGSWEDSAPNALSVLARITGDISQFGIIEAVFDNTVPAADSISCQESSGTVRFQFPNGTGTIATNWTRGLNRKVTYLKFRDDTGKETWACLHHSNESITLGEPGVNDSDLIILDDFREPNVLRMDHHYRGIYNELIAEKSNNMSLGSCITALWTAAYEKARIKT